MAITKIAAVLLVVGLVVGVVAGYGVGFITYQPQISQLQSDLSETQSALSTSQSEVESLRGQLTEATDKITTTEAELTKAKTTITSLGTQLAEAETKYTALSSEYEKFNSDVTSLINSLKKKLDLETEIIKVWCHAARGEEAELVTAIIGLGTYIDAVGDDELSTSWDEVFTYASEGKTTELMAKFADLMERNSALIQSDLSKLDTLLGS